MKIIYWVDGDNSPTVRLRGIEIARPCDEIHIFESVKEKNNLHFKPDYLEKIRKTTKASVDFTSVKSGNQATDFRILIEISRYIMQHNEHCVHILLSDDKHFDIMHREIKAALSPYRVDYCNSIGQAMHKYATLCLSTKEEWKAYLRQTLGELNEDAYKTLTEALSSESSSITSIKKEEPPRSNPLRWWERKNVIR